MIYLLFLPFALAPSFIWLAFFLRKDAHPEPNRMILKVFLFGMLATIPAIYLEQAIQCVFSLEFSVPRCIQTPPHLSPLFTLLYFLFGIALVEEVLKYLAARMGAFSSSALDEPVDVMLYMIIAGLGFAALENVLLLFELIGRYSFSDVFLVNALRFLQAVFLHALSSALLGYFLALSLFLKRHRLLFPLVGFFAAVLLHGLFNFYIVRVGGQNVILLLLPIGVLAIVGLAISFAFSHLKNLKTAKSYETTNSN